MGRIKPYYKVQLQNSDPSADLMQDSIERALTSVTGSPIVNGDLFSGIRLVSGSVNRVEHKMNRAPLGYIVVQKNANATVYDQQDTNTRKDIFLDLMTTADCTVSLWIF
jgi:hypothetical protein